MALLIFLSLQDLDLSSSRKKSASRVTVLLLESKKNKYPTCLNTFLRTFTITSTKCRYIYHRLSVWDMIMIHDTQFSLLIYLLVAFFRDIPNKTPGKICLTCFYIKISFEGFTLFFWYKKSVPTPNVKFFQVYTGVMSCSSTGAFWHGLPSFATKKWDVYGC